MVSACTARRHSLRHLLAARPNRAYVIFVVEIRQFPFPQKNVKSVSEMLLLVLSLERKVLVNNHRHGRHDAVDCPYQS